MAISNDIRAKRMRLEVLDQTIPGAQDRLEQMIKERAGLEAVISRVESHDLGKKHNGLCGAEPENYGSQDEKNKATYVPTCKRFYGHSGLHSWQGGGVG